MNYKVTYYNDCGAWVDPNPTIKIFDLEDEATDWIWKKSDVEWTIYLKIVLILYPKRSVGDLKKKSGTA